MKALRFLVRLFPRAFREEFGAGMGVLVRKVA